MQTGGASGKSIVIFSDDCVEKPGAEIGAGVSAALIASQ